MIVSRTHALTEQLLKIPLYFKRCWVYCVNVLSNYIPTIFILLFVLYHIDDEDVDDCQPNPCAHGGICTDLGLWNFTCECPQGFRGLFCEACKFS